jgi:NAD(P)H-hydrate epimerase
MAIPTINSESDLRVNLEKCDVILDAIFGFSFQPPIRAPFDTALQLMAASKLPIVSVDVPSGETQDRYTSATKGID